MNTKAPSTQSSLTLNDLLRLHDEVFVKKIYLALLGRDADRAGLLNYVGQLRDGVPKEQIVAELARSSEGVRHAANIPGLDAALAAHTGHRPSFWVRALRRFGAVATESSDRRFRALENRLYLIEQGNVQLSKQVADLTSLVRLRLTASSGDSTLRGSWDSGIHRGEPSPPRESAAVDRTVTALTTAIRNKQPQ